MSLNKGVVLVTNRKSDSVTNQILRKDGLSIEKLDKLSYCSKLGINLKKNLHYFDKKSLLKEVVQINEWYDSCDLLYNIATDYRVKSVQSAFLKYERYFPDHQTRKVFDDLLGFRTLCDDYDDGYRGVHVYYQASNYHYPIEIQYNTFYDRQLNNWLHKYVYKQKYDNAVGCVLRKEYENGKIRSESDFKEVLDYVLSDCKEIR